MYIEQIYTNCLSEAAYYIESNGEAAIVDPLRDFDKYLNIAEKRGTKIKYVFETHFHADFVSGHIDLAASTGAKIIFGPGAETNYKVYNAHDGEIFKLGNIQIKAIHTPGHTLESTCYLLYDESGKANAIFTGDTLFVGDVGRPDLSSGGLSSEDLAGIMYDSIQNKIMPLADDIVVYPAHGPGSSCGKNMGPETQSTIGNEKQKNYALQPQSKEDFIKAVTTGLKDAPKYFSLNAKMNKQGYEDIAEIKKNGLKPLSVDELKALLKNDVYILDTRNATVFTQGFIPGSVSVGLEGRFAEWAAMIVPFDRDIVLVTEEGKEEESLIRLSRVGFEKIVGFLKGGYQAWVSAGEKSDMIIDIEADELVMDLPYDNNLVVLDVRKEAEFAGGHLENALNIPTEQFTDITQISQLEDNQNLYIHCAGGYRSVIAASLLKKQGFNNLRNILGGWSKIKDQKNIKVLKEPGMLN
ncbi:MAG: MBL fold metallo-hydrolase [Bacteroidetes bacterium]|nr:MBL fold metallo-hydrolase [Bacteroidota bacterium]